jgi:hypothetical protein
VSLNLRAKHGIKALCLANEKPAASVCWRRVLLAGLRGESTMPGKQHPKSAAERLFRGREAP